MSKFDALPVNDDEAPKSPPPIFELPTPNEEPERVPHVLPLVNSPDSKLRGLDESPKEDDEISIANKRFEATLRRAKQEAEKMPVVNKDVKQLRKEIGETESRFKRTRTLFESQTPLRSSSTRTKEAADSSIPPLVALEKEMETQRKELAEKQKEAEFRHAKELMEERVTREAQRREKLQDKTENKPDNQPDIQVDHEATPEKIFDRRHEVLDRKQATQQQFATKNIAEGSQFEAGPVPISQIISQRVTVSSSKRSSTPTEKEQNISPVNPNEIYKKSLKTGFLAGIAVIIVGLIGYLLLY